MVRRTVAVLASALLLVLATGGTASAASKNGKCESGELCVYRLANYTGGLLDFVGDDANYTNGDVFHGTTYTLDNRATSVVNNDPARCVTLYQDISHAKPMITIGPRSAVSNLRLLDNLASSHKWTAC
ncbi:peptidase inhibitor family I36 protein [Allokutzneria sp. A3M-2-11 16]|uniref:peptidase inhibitor family I36 protein n=1 Tax=Allokutzneria sp. A3M-2-11 16 TaxID=2962043 RepID=UPI0020B7172C|nr:peptidase inhibitor family I36 protein [Allokutzneria sp. A3M-2-11 16]MCP3801561.1 peptidase inhibitor family I36 protein [Allokutzneria sp. A3M-2-11 16]